MSDTAHPPAKGFWSFAVREDPVYRRYERQCAPGGAGARWAYLALYVLPGLFLYAAINIPAVFDAMVALTGLSSKNYQYAATIFVTYPWHMVLPFLILRWSDGLDFRQSLAFLGLDRIDLKSLLLWMPLFFLLFVAASLVYMPLAYGPLQQWTEAIPALRIPPYSIFQAGPDNLYSFPPLMMGIFFVGNFLGEELYFRGYLMKKTAFLGGWNWVFNSVAFSLYHLWQAPQTWPLTGLVIVFGALMQLRKDIWSLIALHVCINLVWPPLMMAIGSLLG